MSEDRTQAPSRRRRQEAKERGQVARSPELTAAAGLLAAVVLLGAFGGELVTALVAAVRAPWLGEAPGLAADPAEVVGGLRRLALGLAMPLGAILGGVVVAIVAAHQAQVGGLWAPGLLAPDPGRLWGGVGAGPGARAARGAWALARAGIIAGVAAWSIRAHLPAFAHLGTLDPSALARAGGLLLRGLALALGAATLALGLADYAGQYLRLEALLRTTPEQQREDQRSIEGDPALRARRQRVARGWRSDPRQALAGATLVLTGGGGSLAVVLAGDPAPRGARVRSSVRLVARGPSAARVLRDAGRSGVPRADAPALALRLARSPGQALPADLAAELAAHWPRA